MLSVKTAKAGAGEEMGCNRAGASHFLPFTFEHPRLVPVRPRSKITRCTPILKAFFLSRDIDLTF
jgi:hypothetical protein